MHVSFQTIVTAVTEPIRRFFSSSGSKIAGLAIAILGAAATAIFSKSMHRSSSKMPLEKKIVPSTQRETTATKVFDKSASPRASKSQERESQPRIPGVHPTAVQRKLNQELAEAIKVRGQKLGANEPEEEVKVEKEAQRELEVAKPQVRKDHRPERKVRFQEPKKTKTNAKAVNLEELPEAKGNLQHMTKDRAAGPARRRPSRPSKSKKTE